DSPGSRPSPYSFTLTRNAISSFRDKFPTENQELRKLDNDGMRQQATRMLSKNSCKVPPPLPDDPENPVTNSKQTILEAQSPLSSNHVNQGLVPTRTRRGESSFALWQISRRRAALRPGIFWDGDQKTPYFCYTIIVLTGI